MTVFAPLAEHERMHYLEAMGIEQYVPRQELPQAQPSLLMHATELSREPNKARAANAQIMAGQASVSGQGNARPKKSLAELVEVELGDKIPANGYSDAVAKSGAQSQAKTEPDPLSHAFVDETEAKIETAEKTLQSLSDILNTPKKTPISFCLSLWCLDNDMLVIDSRRRKQAMPTTALLGNILKYYGLRTRATAPEVIQWPVPGMPTGSLGMQGDAGNNAESAMIAAFLESRLAAQPVSGLWLMGQAAYTHIALSHDQGESLPFDEVLGASVSLTEKKIPSVVLPSLIDMLIEPIYKRTCWMALNRYLNRGSAV